MRMVLAGVAALVLVGGMAFQDEDPRRGGGMQERPRGMMTPPGSMVVHGDFIFVLSGSKLYKVDPVEMKIVGELEIPNTMGGMEDRPKRRPDDE